MTPEFGGQPVPGYVLSARLGVGGFGEVWQARREDGLCVAMKFLDCRRHSPGMVAAEVKTLRSLTSLNHPHIVPLLGVHSWGKYLILMMELADGSLADLHRAYREETGGNVPPDHALDLLAQAAEALDFLAGARLAGANRVGLQHCDVKPSNLLLLGDRLKVADFGLTSGSGWHTHSGWKGTLPYAAPELFGGAPAPGTDQYSLAVTFCELVMGERPFARVDRQASPGSSPIDLTRLREREFPVIARALHAYPSARWPSCKALVQALRAANDKPRQGTSVRIYPRGVAGPLGLAPAAP